jgi:hypothetical protein
MSAATTNRFALLETPDDAAAYAPSKKLKKVDASLQTVYVGHLRTHAEWSHVLRQASEHGCIKRTHLSKPTLDGYYHGFLTMRTAEEAGKVIRAIGSTRYDTVIDSDFETARVITTRIVYAEWAKRH